MKQYISLTLGLLLPALVWAGPAQAFFCMSFGAGSKGRGLAGPPPIMAAPMALASPMPARWVAPSPPEAPVTDTRTPEPELVEWPVRKNGRLTETRFRFRPLEERRASPVSATGR